MPESKIGATIAADEPLLQPRIAQVGTVDVAAFASLADCATFALNLVHTGQGGSAVAINAEKVVSCRSSPDMVKIIANARLRYPDGAGVVLAMRTKGVRTARIAGADLWLQILRSAGPTTRIAVVGARPTVLRQALDRIDAEFPHINVVLGRDGYEGIRDVDELGQALVAASPGIVFVAMGSPRQEQVIDHLMKYQQSALYMGLGGSLDIYAGVKRRAPVWMQQIGLEWLYRLASEPSRIRRQFNLPRFVWLLLTRQL